MPNLATWSWPQYTMMACQAIALLILAHRHGKPKQGTENFWGGLAATIAATTLLYCGGFYTP